MNSVKVGMVIISLFFLSGISAFACSAHATAESSASTPDGDKPVQG